MILFFSCSLNQTIILKIVLIAFHLLSIHIQDVSCTEQSRIMVLRQNLCFAYQHVELKNQVPVSRNHHKIKYPDLKCVDPNVFSARDRHPVQFDAIRLIIHVE